MPVGIYFGISHMHVFNLGGAEKETGGPDCLLSCISDLVDRTELSSAVTELGNDRFNLFGLPHHSL